MRACVSLCACVRACVCACVRVCVYAHTHNPPPLPPPTQTCANQVMDATRGDMFGENELLGLTLEGRRNRTSVAQTSCELCRMSAAHFRALLESCPDLQRRCRLLV